MIPFIESMLNSASGSGQQEGASTEAVMCSTRVNGEKCDEEQSLHLFRISIPI